MHFNFQHRFMLFSLIIISSHLIPSTMSDFAMTLNRLTWTLSFTLTSGHWQLTRQSRQYWNTETSIAINFKISKLFMGLSFGWYCWLFATVVIINWILSNFTIYYYNYYFFIMSVPRCVVVIHLFSSKWS